MPLAECQVQVRDLVMGPGTSYKVLPEFNPFVRRVRADQGGPRAWNHGSWSGAEWMDEAVVPVPVSVVASDRTLTSWLPLHQQLAAAFAPIGDDTAAVELRWRFGGAEYVLFGRPRLVEPRANNIAVGRAFTPCAFVAQDPRIYSGTLHTAQTSLPEQIGGLTVPLTVPFTIDGVLVGGSVQIVNAGTTDTGLVLRIDGPAVEPTIALQRPDGEVQRVRFDLTLATGQWLDVNTASRTALLNGLPQANQRGRAIWDIDPYPLPPGTSTVRFAAGDFNPTALLTVSWHDAWW